MHNRGLKTQLYLNRVELKVFKITGDHVTQNVESAFLQSIDEVDERARVELQIYTVP